MELIHGTRRDDLKLINELILTFLSVSLEVENKQSMFFALIFSNIMQINTSISIEEINIDSYNYFLEELNALYPLTYSSNYIQAKYLLDPVYFIRPSSNDIQIFLDILNYCQPVYVYRDKVLATMYDSTIALTPLEKGIKLKREIKDIITNSLILFTNRLNNIKHPLLNNNLSYNIKKIGSNMDKITLVKKPKEL